METFGTELRRAREERKISLHQIAETTLINIKFLEAIERGDMSLLPQAYVRAFIREYASVIGLDPAEVMRKYDDATQPTQGKGLPEPPLPTASSASVPAVPPGDKPPSSFPKSLHNVLLVVIVLAIGGVTLWLRNTDYTSKPEEIPFQEVVRENESKVAPEARPTIAPQPAVALKDSLILIATSSDSVWIQIALDGEPARDYIFPPNMKKSWKAKEKFTVTLGNAGAVTFTLNGNAITSLGRRGAVVRDVEISPRTHPLP